MFSIKLSSIEKAFIFTLFFTGSSIIKLFIGFPIDLILMVFLGLLFLYSKKIIDKNYLFYGFILSYLFFILSSFLSSFSQQYIVLSDFINYLIKFIFFILVYYIFSNITILNIPKLYTKIMYWLTLLAIVSLVYYVLIGIEIHSFNIDLRSYHNYLFTWVLKDNMYDSTLVSLGGGISIPRLQSMFEEPGTYSFFILPALIYSITTKNHKYTIVLLLGLLLTFSMGAWILFLVFLVFYFKNIMSNKTFIYILILTSLLIAGFMFQEVLHYVLVKFGTDEIASTGHSLQYRLAIIEKTIEALSNFELLGFGINNLDQYSYYGFHTRSIYPHLIRGGYLGFICFTIMVFILFMLIFILRNRDQSSIFFSSLLFALLIMGTQRSSFIDSYFSLFYVAVSLKYFFIKGIHFARQNQHYTSSI